MTDTASDGARSDRWWTPIAALTATLSVTVFLTLVLPPDAFAMLPVTLVTLVGVVLVLLSPAFVHFDRQYLAAQHSWTPSNWYYLMVALPVSPVVAAVYLYGRHERIGVP